MKKLLVLLMLSMVPCYAVTATVHRYQKEISDACLYTLSSKYTMVNTFMCFATTASKDSIWRPGYTQPVKADVITLLAKPYDPKGVADTNSEILTAPSMKMMMTNSFYEGAKSLRAQGYSNTFYTPEMLKKMR